MYNDIRKGKGKGMKKIRITKKDNNSIAFYLGERFVGSLQIGRTWPDNGFFNPPEPFVIIDINNKDDRIIVSFALEEQKMTAAAEFYPIKNGFSGKLIASGSGHAMIRAIWELPEEEAGFPFIPAFMYGHNKGGRHSLAMYPQLKENDEDIKCKPWISEEWLVRTDRSSHGCSAVIGSKTAFAIGGRDVCRYDDGTVAEKNGIGISSTNPHRISFSLGFANIPFTYSVAPGRNFYNRPEGYINLDKGTVSADFFLLLFNHNGRHDAASKILRESYALLHDEVKNFGDIDDAIIAISNTLLDYCYCPDAKNFHVTVPFNKGIRDTGSDSYAKGDNFANAWAGGLRTAWPLLAAGHQYNNEKWQECARTVFSNMASNAISPVSGLFYENYNLPNDEWNAKGWYYGALDKPGHSGYVNGQMCHYMLLAYLKEKEAGINQAFWLNASQSVLDRIFDNQGKEGQFGYTYSEKNGTIIDDNGFCGCWFVPAFASLYRITGNKKYLSAASRAMDYYRHFVEQFEAYGTPHDAVKSPDEEGILAWIEAARMLHELTGKEKFLKDLLMGLDYEFSWKFAYNAVIEIEPLKSMNWCSTGGSVTSANNCHIHPMCSAVLSSILYAWKQTGDPYLHARLIDTLRWTLSVYLRYDGHYGWGKRGMINERFCHSDSFLLERFPDGSPSSTWFSAHSWASGAVLEGLIDEKLKELVV